MIGWNLKDVLQEQGVSVSELARRIGYHRVTVSEWANSSKLPKFDDPEKVLNLLCTHLPCTPGDLITFTPD